MERIKEKNLSRQYHDLLEIARLVSWCVNQDYIIKTCLSHLSQRLGKRARCVLQEGNELRLNCWVGEYECPIEQVPICKESIVWEVVNEGTPVNLTDQRQTNGYLHTLAEQIKIKAIIPLRYVDPLTQEEKRVGALIVDSGKEGVPISEGEFEYLKVVGELIGAAAGKAELVEQLVESYRMKEAMVREAVHVLRNATVAIGGFARRIAQLAKNTDLAQAARSVLEEAQALEVYLERFEKYIKI